MTFYQRYSKKDTPITSLTKTEKDVINNRFIFYKFDFVTRSKWFFHDFDQLKDTKKYWNHLKYLPGFIDLFEKHEIEYELLKKEFELYKINNNPFLIDYPNSNKTLCNGGLDKKCKDECVRCELLNNVYCNCNDCKKLLNCIIL